MILGEMTSNACYVNMHPKFKLAFEFLEKCFDKGVEAGRYEIDGNDVYALVMEYISKEKETPRFETHDNYIDIQCMLKGSECQWYLPRKEMRELAPYNPEKDITFYSFEGRGSELLLQPGDYAIYFPQDGHLPGMVAAPNEDCTRIVVKIKC